MYGSNAEASTSRRTLDSTKTRRSGRARALSDATTAVISPPISTAGSKNLSPPQPQRKVRTIPPSAIFDPPTPPLESQPTFDTARRPPPSAAKSAKRRRRLRYVSSDESPCESDDDTDDDDEPPWWTFTARGMSKLRAMGTATRNNSGDPESGAESGGEAQPKDKNKEHRWRDRPDKSKDRKQRQGTAAPRVDSGGEATPVTRTGAKLFNPRPFRMPTAILTRRSSELARGPSTSEATSPIVAPPLTRSNSAPGVRPPSIAALAAAGIVRTDTPEQIPAGDTDAHERPSAKRTSSSRRFLPGRTRSSFDGADHLTDSEAAMATSPRFRARQRLWFGGVPEESTVVDLSDPTPTGSGAATPTPHPKMRRINTNNLRIRLPPPISQHFANGWPHAGSWQDALRTGDVFEESYIQGKEGLIRPSTLHRNSGSKDDAGSLRQSTATVPATPPPGSLLQREQDGASTDTDGVHGKGSVLNSSVLSGSINGGANPSSLRVRASTRPPLITRSSSEAPLERPVRPKRKERKSRKSRRYRQAQVPPTPGGLGFTPSIRGGSIEEPSVSQSVATETNPFDNLNPFDRIDEEMSLSPQQSPLSEKGAKRRGWAPWRRHSATGTLPWNEHLRRMLFLDARITIYLRLFNMAIVITLLALAVSIRNKLISIGYPGVIGPSTTLIIAYASFTAVHVLLAIYREYFGRPIGLWGLRSKMLWVCLDLLFVALWSSALTLAVNDFIDTPLDCSPLSPWWTPGYDYYGSGVTGRTAAMSFVVDAIVPDSVKRSPAVGDACRRQAACIAISLVAVLLYCGNMVLSLFRIFETVRRTAQTGRRMSV